MARGIEQFWRILPAVRRRERSRTLFFIGLFTLVMAAQTVGLAGSEALFLAELSAQRLPHAFVVASLVSALGSLLYAARVGISRNDVIFAQMLLGAGVALALVPFAAPEPGAALLFGLVAAFYLTQSIFTNHFWTFSGDYFDTVTSKRLFPVFMVGSSFGGLLGGAAGAWTAHRIGAVATIGVWGALLCLAALLLLLARRPLRRWGPLELEEADATSVAGMRAAVAYVRGTQLGRWMAVSALGMVLALFVAQYIYSDLFVRAVPEPGRLAVFIGAYLALTNLVEIALVLAVTPWLIRRFGVASAHAVHPMLTLVSFAALFASPVLATAVAARANRELIENALAEPVRTLVFNAVPLRFRGRVRAFLEGIAVYAGMGAAGLLLLALNDPDPRALAALGGSAAALYLAANLGVRRAYLSTLIDGIRSGRIDLSDVDSQIGDWDADRLAELCDELLRQETQRPSHSLLQLIPRLGQRGILAPLLRGLAHPWPSVRTQAALALAGHAEAEGPLRDALADGDAEVRMAAIQALYAASARNDRKPSGAQRGEAERRSDGTAERLCRDPDPRVRAVAAAACSGRSAGSQLLVRMLASSDRDEKLAALRVADRAAALDVARCAGDADPEVRAAALERLAEIAPDQVPDEALANALDADEPRVRSAALRLAASVADRDGLERVAQALRDPRAAVSRTAAAALAARGEAGVEAAFPYLRDATERTAVVALAVVAGGEHPRRRQLLAGELRRRVGLAWAALVGTTHIPPAGDLASRFLRAATSDAWMRERRLAFRILEHLESARVVHRVEHALRFGTARARGDALEVLSNLGDREAARQLVLMHEAGPIEDRVLALGAGVPVSRSRAEFLEAVQRSEERWVRLALAALQSGVRDTGSPESTIMERLLALKRVPLFESLSLDQLDAVQRLAREQTFLPGEVIVREGDSGGELYLLLEGSAEAWLDYAGPQRKRLSTIEAGGYFGEMAILDDEPRSATVVVIEHARVLALDGNSLKALVLQMPEIAFELLRVMSARVRASERRLLER